jgi:hypothetical protein
MTPMARIVGDFPAFIRVIGAIRGQELCGLKIVADLHDPEDSCHTSNNRSIVRP